jgi:SPP1 gp7 family putative phage head morphogenesis protein
VRQRRLSLDREPERPSFVQARKVERNYVAQLRKIARHIGELVSANPPVDGIESVALTDRLRKYAALIRPWANAVGTRMIADVSRKDREVWRSRSSEMGVALRREIETAPTGEAQRALLVEQVRLITSMPTDAADRVHKLVVEGMFNSARASEIAAEIMRTGQVTKSRATLIARTEVGRAATTLTQVRAEHIGSEGYIWRTAEDSSVRPSHAKMDGKVVRWESPPTLDGLTGHAGALPNCRCYPEPLVPEL